MESVVVTTSFLASFECCRVVTETADVLKRQNIGSQKTIDLGEVTERRSGESVLLIECPGDLAGVERNRYVVLHWCVERLGQIVVLAFLWIERAEEPQLVFHNRATDVATNVSF